MGFETETPGQAAQRGPYRCCLSGSGRRDEAVARDEFAVGDGDWGGDGGGVELLADLSG